MLSLATEKLDGVSIARLDVEQNHNLMVKSWSVRFVPKKFIDVSRNWVNLKVVNSFVVKVAKRFGEIHFLLRRDILIGQMELAPTKTY